MANAEASSSKLPRSIIVRRKSYDALKKAESAAASPPATAPAAVGRAGGSDLKSPASTAHTATSSRRIRTVPPSAAFEPPTPPSPAHEPTGDVPPLDQTAQNASAGSTAQTTHNTHPRRRPPRLRYSTSDSSADSTDAVSSEEETPWWTFTQRGMAKMRARTLPKREVTEDPRPVSGAESGMDSARDVTDRSRRGSRQSSKDKKGTPASSIRRGRAKHEQELAPPAQIRPPNKSSSSPIASSLLWRRSYGREPQLAPLSIDPPPITRSNSAPSSPAPIEILPRTESPAPLAEHAVESPQNDPLALTKPLAPSSTRRSVLSPKRQLTAPAFPRFLKRGDMDVHTDTETGGATVPRAKQREKMSPRAGSMPLGPIGASLSNAEDGASTPSHSKPRKRQQTRLKINLPDPISQHFAEGWPKGWPHAGTWQDAYYGYYSEQQASDTNVPGSLSSRRNSEARARAGENRRKPTRDQEGQRFATPDRSDPSLPNSPTPPESQPATRKKSRRARRYRPALAPPTPSGLGFTPNGGQRDDEGWKEGRVGASDRGFDWNSNNQANGDQNGQPARIDEGDELARADTQVTHEKSSAGSSVRRRKWWMPRKKQRMMQNGRYEKISWKKKWRRMLFLDARVTIYIRLINLAVVIVSLALAVHIRLQLDQLRVPGLLGSSTTLLIAFSSLTIVHVLLAIYREYFGKPIGLWGLRSKMLWVCLDLAFIAFWSSSLSLAINDYIATPLLCTSETPWWRTGLAQSYAQLLQSLQLARAAGADINASSSANTTGSALGDIVTPVDMITHSLGIVLPSEITESSLADQICDKQVGSIVLALLTLLLYTVNMVLSLFRIFETVRRTANVDRAVMA